MDEWSKFQEHEKITLLRINKWYCVEGYCMEYEKPDEANNVVLSFEEVCKKLKEGIAWQCLPEHGEYFYDLDTAWDDYIDEVTNQMMEQTNENMMHLPMII